MKYEYMTIRKNVEIPYNGSEKNADAAIEEYLNVIGDDCWELISYDVIVDYSNLNKTAQVSIYGIAKREKKNSSCFDPVLCNTVSKNQ